ncbi:YdcH family protein [Arenimonas sp.]|uniref:YdcH family protein n=1 Tax=Arenimonas sp. TaxID=1872635 RepID=UPI0037C0C680
MQTSMLSHSLATEFPELSEKIHALKASNQHFARLLAEHDAIDQRIIRDEEKIEPLNDETLHELKQKRLKLKDELYQMAKAA